MPEAAVRTPEALLADVLVGYSTDVRAGDFVLIEAPLLAAPAIRALYRRAVEAGANPVARASLDELAEHLFRDGTDAQLQWVNPARSEDLERADVRIALLAPTNTRRLTTADPARQALYARAHQPLQDRYLARAAAGQFRWTVASYPTNAAAQDAEMSLPEYEEFVARASFLDRRDPVEEWRSFAERVERTADFLGERSELRVLAEDTDLTFTVAGRTWVAGKGKENFPDGEVFTGPVETSVSGTIRFTYPAIFQAREVDDVQLRFDGGEVVEARARRGEEFLTQMIAMDDGARRVGEFAFGLNDAVDVFTRNTLFDEKIGGTVHLALGAAYPESGGVNSSALHWDMVCDLRGGSEIYADGELVYRDGRFLVDALVADGA